MKHLRFTLLFILLPALLQARYTICVNDNWTFHRGELEDTHRQDNPIMWEPVSIPHTWNATDAFDHEPGYYRGVGWYRRTILTSALPDFKRMHLYFEAANQVAEVFVNGAHAGVHRGGYTAFAFDITPFLRPDTNTILVRVDNSHDDLIPPLKGDFNFYGGIYRDVFLVLTGDMYTGLSEYAASGVYISTKSINGHSAEVDVRARVFNANSGLHDVRKCRLRVFDSEGILKGEALLDLDGSLPKQEVSGVLQIENAQLWSPHQPSLYLLVCQVIDPETGHVLDEVSEHFGIRQFAFHPDSGFSINGDYMKLIGVNRHQDMPGKGNALSNEDHIRDMVRIKDMGCNFFRTAHYPQDKAVLSACDRLGMVVTMEIPLDHDQTDDPVFYANTRKMLLEMIHQYYNHPSIVIWAYMNEMLLWRDLERDSAEIASITRFASELEELIRSEDPTRYTMIPNHGEFDIYNESGLADVPMIVGWNLYFGWYVEGFEGFGDFLDRAHFALPDKPMLVTEYGAGAHPGIRSFNPSRFDFSQEWETMFHQAHLRQIRERPFVAASAVWNMFDFGSVNRGDAMPYVNNKGLCTFDRRPKDAYHLYRSALDSRPYLVFGGKEMEDWILPGNGAGGTGKFPVTAFGNVDSAELFINGVSTGVQHFEDYKATWASDLLPGKYNLVLKSGSMVDTRDLSVSTISLNVPFPGEALRVNLGADYYYNPLGERTSWMPGELLRQEGWDMISGNAFRPRNIGIGTDRNIDNTYDDPLYQTQLMDPDTLRINVVPGKVLLRLGFTELEGKLAGDRVFSVIVNDEVLIASLDLAGGFGQFVAVDYVIPVAIEDDGKLEIVFESIQGLPVVNCIQVIRN